MTNNKIWKKLLKEHNLKHPKPNPIKTNKICSICYKPFTEYGNNAEPINNGRCCNICNMLTIQAKIQIMKNNNYK